MKESTSVFISYSHKDLNSVAEIADTLQEILGIEVWYDNNLRGGDNYFSEIAEQILQKDYFIFVVSQNSVSSNWCVKELEFAMSENKKIIAIWLEDFSPPPRIRLVISNTHYIMRNQMSLDEFKKVLEEAIANITVPSQIQYQFDDELIFHRDAEHKYYLSDKQYSLINSLLKKEEDRQFTECSVGEAPILLGIAYELGAGTAPNYEKAKYYYSVGKFNGSLDAEFLLLMLENNTQKTISDSQKREFYKLANAGSILAMVYWGEIVYLGDYGVKQDIESAAKWWKTASTSHPLAQFYYSEITRTCVEDNRNYYISFMLAARASEADLPCAYRVFGQMYQNGEFIEKSDEKAEESYKTALVRGDYLSEYYLGNIEYSKGDYSKAFYHYSQTSYYINGGKLKSYTPLMALAHCYYEGKGTEKNIKKAAEYYLSAGIMNANNVASEFYRCILNANNDEIPPTQKEEYFLQMISADCRRAEFYYGQYLESIGKINKALEQYNLGADKGDMRCCFELLCYYSYAQGKKPYQNRNTALKCFELFLAMYEKESDPSFIKTIKSDGTFSKVLFWYAMELDIGEENLKPDSKQALYYYRKCLSAESVTWCFPSLLSIAEGFFNPNLFYKPDDITRNINHGFEILELIYPYVEDYLSCMLNNAPDNTECVSKVKRYHEICVFYSKLSFKERIFYYVLRNIFHDNDSYPLKVKWCNDAAKHLKTKFWIDINHTDALYRFWCKKYIQSSDINQLEKLDIVSNKNEETSIFYTGIYDIFVYNNKEYMLLYRLPDSQSKKEHPSKRLEFYFIRLDKSSDGRETYSHLESEEFHAVYDYYKKKVGELPWKNMKPRESRKSP